MLFTIVNTLHRIELCGYTTTVVVVNVVHHNVIIIFQSEIVII